MQRCCRIIPSCHFQPLLAEAELPDLLADTKGSYWGLRQGQALRGLRENPITIKEIAMAKAMYEDRLLKKLTEWAALESDRAYEVGEQRADMKEFLETTGWEKTALSWARKLDKMSIDKRNDLLRSFDDLREILRQHWDGQNSGEMAFTDTVVPFAASSAPVGGDLDDPVEVDPDAAADAEADTWDDDGDPDIAEEADGFDANLAEVAAE